MVLIMPTATRRPVVPDGSQPTVGKVNFNRIICLQYNIALGFRKRKNIVIRKEIRIKKSKRH